MDALPSTTMADLPDPHELRDIVCSAGAEAASRGVFDRVENLADRIRCHAKGCPEPAWYELSCERGRIVVRFATPDRWLSESIESDLMHFGDPIEELVEEELAELGWRGKVPPIRHFRDEAKLYTFENDVPMGTSAGSSSTGSSSTGTPDRGLAAKFLLAYEAAFRSLGDVGGETDE